jgi:hypothetical protein
MMGNADLHKICNFYIKQGKIVCVGFVQFGSFKTALVSVKI